MEMGLTPKRVQRVLDAWDEATAPGRETAFTGYLLIAVMITVAGVVAESWFALIGVVMIVVVGRMLWELPGSRVRRVCDALLRNRR
jgi:hypothetical protein